VERRSAVTVARKGIGPATQQRLDRSDVARGCGCGCVKTASGRDFRTRRRRLCDPRWREQGREGDHE
jgi:hypothetical protein